MIHSFQVCVTMKAAAVGAQTERRGSLWPVRKLLAGVASPALCFLFRFSRAQQLRRLSAKSLEFFVAGPVLLHPGDSARVPPAGLVLLAQSPVGHRQEERVEADQFTLVY